MSLQSTKDLIQKFLNDNANEFCDAAVYGYFEDAIADIEIQMMADVPTPRTAFDVQGMRVGP